VVGSVTDDGTEPVEGIGDDSFRGAGPEELDIRGGKPEPLAGPAGHSDTCMITTFAAVTSRAAPEFCQAVTSM